MHAIAAEHLGQLKKKSATQGVQQCVVKVNWAAVVCESALVTLSIQLICYFTFHTCTQAFANANICCLAYFIFELL